MIWVCWALILHFEVFANVACISLTAFPLDENAQPNFIKETISPLITNGSLLNMITVFDSMGKTSLFNWALHRDVYSHVKRYLGIILLTLHPWLGIIFHNPSDSFNSFHRLAILICGLLSFLAANAVFFGQQSLSLSDISIAIISVAMVTPVQFFLKYFV